MEMAAHAYPADLGSSRRARSTARSVRVPLGVAALCALGVALVWLLAAIVPATHVRDAVLLQDFVNLSGPHVDSPLRFLLHLLRPLPFVLWAIALIAIALAQERPRVALAAGAVLGLAPLTSELLKPLAAHPHARVGSIVPGAASFPSGHAAAALALVLCAMLVSRPRWRPLVAVLGGLYVAGVAVALLVFAWHMPSDVLGGLLVATLWMALALAALRACERRWPTGSRARAAGQGAPSSSPPAG